MESAARCFFRTSKSRTHHDAVCAAGNGFANIAARGHAAIGDDRNIFTGLFVIIFTCRRAIRDRSHLRNANPENATGRAGRTGTDTDKKSGSSCIRELHSDLVGHAIAEDHRDLHLLAKFSEIHDLIRLGNMAHRRHRRLHHKNIRAGFLCDLAEFLSSLRDRTHRAQHTGFFDLLDTFGDQFFADGLHIKSLHQLGRFFWSGL